MSTFELETATAARMVEYGVLSDKDREPDTNPGCALSFALTVANDVLTMFDGSLRSTLYCKNANSTQESIVEDLPNLTAIGKALGQFNWALELTGYTLTFDHGLAGGSNIVLKDCKLTDWKIQCKEGGSVTLKFKAEAPDVSEKHLGRLATFKSQEVQVLLKAPEVEAPGQTDIEPGIPTKKDKRQTPVEALAATLGHDAITH
jgi:hypothetical protein